MFEKRTPVLPDNRENVYIVLSRSSTVLSRVIGAMTGDAHTHAAIALDDSLETMFSFGRRRASNPFIGCFKRERLDDELYVKLGILPGVVLEISVTGEQHELIRKNIELFRSHSEEYSYNVLGLIYGACGLTHERRDRFFCSEFVYFVLRESGVCDFGIPRGLVRPEMLLRLRGKTVFRGDLLTYYDKYNSANMAIRTASAL